MRSYISLDEGFELQPHPSPVALPSTRAAPSPAHPQLLAAPRLRPWLEHAVYLGRELARAEESLRTGAP